MLVPGQMAGNIARDQKVRVKRNKVRMRKDSGGGKSSARQISLNKVFVGKGHDKNWL